MIEPTKPEPTNEAIYSKWAILGFCIFFSPIFGGVLIRQNLIGVHRKREANLLLLLSVLMAFLTAMLASTPYGGSGTTILANFLQGALLVEFSFKKYLPHADELPKKTIWRPLSTSLMIVAALLMLMILLGVPLQEVKP
jgi:O-antigen/teichoic acid export membrane protein